MFVEVGYCDFPDSEAAGSAAVRQALDKAGRTDPCDFAFLFCTSRHDQFVLRSAALSELGGNTPIYGGGAVGAITNDRFGYAGDQVGVACVWLEDIKMEAFTDRGLLSGEEAVGVRLGRQLAAAGMAADSNTLLLYDAIGKRQNTGVTMLMATQILAGLEKELGFLPNLAGAGLMGDHALSGSMQFIGEEMSGHTATLMCFSGDIRMDTVIMRGCRPASAYYTVTKAEGSVILEINHRPAIDFMDDLLGAAIKPEQYPLRLLLGINSGDPFGPFDEEQYTIHLCLEIDRRRGGIIMFESDMVEGTRFQLMYRMFEPDYLKNRFEEALERLEGRKPVFALYLDCIGRCAGYGGADIEDALFLQQAVGYSIPVLGIYTGVEIAPVNGVPRGLDLTGVLCLFSEGGEKAKPPLIKKACPKVIPDIHDVPNDFLSELCESNAARIMALDTQITALRYDLELKRRGFHFLSELAISLRKTTEYQEAFEQVAMRLNAALNMQKTAVLLNTGEDEFTPIVLQGFSHSDRQTLKNIKLHLSKALFENCPAVISSDNIPKPYRQLYELFSLSTFVASPIFLQGEVAALLITGRITEAPPYYTRLGLSDMETVYAVTELLGSILVRKRLRDVTIQAETDSLTGLLNRKAFQGRVEDFLSGGIDRPSAMMILDVDDFKRVNDIYGHIAGDKVLKACAQAMRDQLRDTDLIARPGGDEFMVFCAGIRDFAAAKRRAQRIIKTWKNIRPAPDAPGISGSIGLSFSPAHGINFMDLYAKADMALYRAKGMGRGCFVIYEPREES